MKYFIEAFAEANVRVDILVVEQVCALLVTKCLSADPGLLSQFLIDFREVRFCFGAQA